jgi:hypothetical protein
VQIFDAIETMSTPALASFVRLVYGAFYMQGRDDSRESLADLAFDACLYDGALPFRRATDSGSEGEPCPYGENTHGDVSELLHDAWHDGIVGRKLVVRLESRECREWCTNDPDHLECEACQGTKRDPCAIAEVSGPFAQEWADWDGHIGGSSWDTPSDMPDFAYAMPCDYPGLVEALRAEGYELDLSNYEEFEA